MDIAGGALPSTISHLTSLGKSSDSSAETSVLGDNTGDAVDKPVVIDMVVCSFALHLVQSPSELFSLLWELSTKARWLVVLAPHKKPQVRPCFGPLRGCFIGSVSDQGRVGVGEVGLRQLG